MDVSASYLLKWRSSRSLIQSINFTARLSLGAQTLLVLPPPIPPPSLQLFGCILPGEGWEHRYLGILAGPGWSDSHKKRKEALYRKLEVWATKSKACVVRWGTWQYVDRLPTAPITIYPAPHAPRGKSTPHCHRFFKVLTGDRYCEINHSHWCYS